jgi:hypothetical protein
VQWSAALGRAIPLTGAQALKAPANVGGVTPADKKTLDSLEAVREAATDNASAANDFAERNEQTDTGPWHGLWDGKGASLLHTRGYENFPAMQADSIQLAAGAKPAAIQRLTQGEIGWLRGAAPNIANPISANQPLQQRYNDKMIQASAKQSFYSSYQRVKGNLAGADDAWNAYQAKRFDPTGAYIKPTKAQQNAALKQQSAQATGAPVFLGAE